MTFDDHRRTILSMTDLPLSRIATSETPRERATARELLLLQASALMARQVSEQFWARTIGIGTIIFALVGAATLAHNMGVLDLRGFSRIDIVGLSQLLALLAFLLTAAMFVVGRLRLLRSEVDLLTLKIEMLSDDPAQETLPETGTRQANATNPRRGLRQHRRLNIKPQG